MRYSFSNNEALNANATGNALSDTTISAVSNNGTERDRTNTVVGEYTSALRSNLLLEIRGQYSREQRPRDANALHAAASRAPSATSARSASSARTSSATGAASSRPT